MRTGLLVVVLAALLPGFTAAQPAAAPASPQAVRELAAAGKGFPGAALADMDLAALRCSGLDLSGTNWARADLRGASFTAVNLSGAVMEEVIARGVSFTDCNLTGALLRQADLSGAQFHGAQLEGADFAGSKLHGAEFEGVTFSRIGGRHAGALAAALGALSAGGAQVGGSPWSPTLIAGLTGDAFGFVYNPADPAQSPAQPFTDSPLRAALVAAGHDVKTYFDLAPAKALETLTSAVQGGKVCLLPISLAGEQMDGKDFEQAFWAVAVGMDDLEKPARVVLLVPPFGQREYAPADLAARWAGPWPTLEPADAQRPAARHPLLVVTRAATARPMRETVLAAEKHAIAAINDRRTYGSLVPGIVGLQRLSEDLAQAAKLGDSQRMTALSAWGGKPRAALVSARQVAAEFLEQAATAMPEADRPDMVRAAGLLRSEAQVLAERFPSLKSEGTLTPEELRARYEEASRALGEVARIEAAATGLLAHRG